MTDTTDEGIGSWPWRRSRITPHAVALQQGSTRVSYAQLAERVEALADTLSARGLGPGQRLAYLGPHTIAAWETLFATARCGALFVPLSPRLTSAEVEFLLTDTGARILAHTSETKTLAAQAAGHRIRLLGLPGAEPAPDATDYEQLLAAGSPPRRPVRVRERDPAVILYTSGTTGLPKGVVLTHGNLTAHTTGQLAHIDVNTGDTVLAAAPMFHATGLNICTLPALLKGGRILLPPPGSFDPAWTLRAIEEHRIAGFGTVPTMLQLLAEHPEFDIADLSSLRYVIVGGSPTPDHVAAAWHHRGVPLLHGYGQTEAAPIIYLTTAAEAHRDPRSVGRPLFGTSIALRTEDGTLTPPPGRGELLVKGPQVSTGYWRRPRATARALHEGWLRTGDQVEVGEDGITHVLGRADDMYITGAENVHPAEVEQHLRHLPGVADAAVVGVPDPKWGQTGCAFLELLPGAAPLADDDVRAHLTGRLARYKHPRHIRTVTALPRTTATGKVRRQVLRDLYAAETEEGSGPTPPGPHDHPPARASREQEK